MKFSTFKHSHGKAGIVNIGDYIQSVASRQFLPQVDFYVERDRLNDASYEEAKIIMNGWFTYHPENWPPNENLIPLFVSFHLNPLYADKLLSDKRNIEYLCRHAPIGCRDFSTVRILDKYGIEAYYSSCLTTTLDKYKSKEKNDNIYLVDALYNYDQRWLYKADPKRIIYHTLNGHIFKNLRLQQKNKILKEMIPRAIIKSSIKKDVVISNKLSPDIAYKQAEIALEEYAKAKLVITSRIHCALPCIAMGTPVLFILEELDGFENHISRFDGTLDYINILTKRSEKEINKIFGKKMNVIHPSEIKWDTPPENPNTHIQYAEQLKQVCQNFIKE